MINFIETLIKKYLLNSFFLILPMIVNILVSLVVLPIILKYLPAEDYGKFQFILALQIWLVVLTGGYITTGAKRGIAKGLDGTFIYAFLARLKLLIIIGVLGLIISYFLYIIGLITLSILLITMCFFLVFGYLPQASYAEFFIAKKKFRGLAIWKTIIPVLTLIVSSTVVFLTQNILLFAITWFGSITIMSWIAWLYIVKKYKLLSAYRRAEIDEGCVFYGKKLIPAEIILATTNKLASFIIGPFFGFANLAIFSIAQRLIEKLRGFMKISYNLFYSEFARADQRKLAKKLKSRLLMILIVSTIFALTCVVAGCFYIYLFLPKMYNSSITYFLILSSGLPVTILNVLMRLMLEANFRYKELTALIVLPNLIKLLLVLALGFIFKMNGICWAIALGEWINFLFYYLLTFKRELMLKFVHNHSWIEELVRKY